MPELSADPPHHQLPRVPHRLDVAGGGVHASRERIVADLPGHHGVTRVQEASRTEAVQRLPGDLPTHGPVG